MRGLALGVQFRGAEAVGHVSHDFEQRAHRVLHCLEDAIGWWGKGDRVQPVRGLPRDVQHIAHLSRQNQVRMLAYKHGQSKYTLRGG